MDNEKIISNKSIGRLFFSTRSYPIFGRSAFNENNPPAKVVSSPYYWWFMFLRLNEDYRATFEANGEGLCAEMYKDFGDIYSCLFKQWWHDHACLFAEPRKGYLMQIANNAKELAPFESDEVINLVVPLTWSQRSLKKRFTELVLSKIEKGKRGVSVEASEAKYRLSGKWHIEALKSAYKVYMLRTEHSEGTEFDTATTAIGDKRKTTRYKLAWADVAIRAKLDVANGLKEGVKTQKNTDERRIATIVAMRHFKRAQQFINAAATSSFPQK